MQNLWKCRVFRYTLFGVKSPEYVREWVKIEGKPHLKKPIIPKSF